MYVYSRKSSLPAAVPVRLDHRFPASRLGAGGGPRLLGRALRWPGGGQAVTASGLRGLADSLGQCVPRPALLNAAQLARAVRNNPVFARTVGWGTLRDQIEVNILGCPRANPRLAGPDFAQAVAQFQRRHRLTMDGMLGSNSWAAMNVLRVERDPFPRTGLSLDFDDTAAALSCEAHAHPGIDILAAAGTPVPAVADGIVVYAGIMGSIRNCATAQACQAGSGANVCNFISYGRAVLIEHPDRGPGIQPGGQSVYTVCAHLQFRGSHRVSSGERVRAGRIVGEVGSGCVGFSSGPHLHYVVATGPRGYRLRAGGPSRCQICARNYCDAASCPRCNFVHFWDLVTPRRPRTTSAAGFRW